MSKKENIENEVYFLGNKKKAKSNTSKKRFIALALVFALLIVVLLFIISNNKKEDYYFEPENTNNTVIVENNTDSVKSYIERLEETINDVPMYIYIPHNAKLSLEVTSQPLTNDSSIICMMQAADIRTDNMEIVGDFVLKGKRLSRGIAKQGFCSIIENEVTIGVSSHPPLLEQAIKNGGYFFRQYPLVFQERLVENSLKNKSIRRALAIRSGKVIMIESRSNESLHDFAQALIDIGITDAITLVGSTRAYGWFTDESGIKNEYGNIPDTQLQNVSYIVWRKAN
jgi:hypothetical protein